MITFEVKTQVGDKEINFIQGIKKDSIQDFVYVREDKTLLIQTNIVVAATVLDNVAEIVKPLPNEAGKYSKTNPKIDFSVKPVKKDTLFTYKINQPAAIIAILKVFGFDVSADFEENTSKKLDIIV